MGGDSDSSEFKGDFGNLIGWLGAFHLLTPITEPLERKCFIDRLKASRYTVDEDAIGVLAAERSGRTVELYACNCGVFVHYSLCKHSVSRGRADGIISKMPPQFNTQKRNAGAAKPGRRKKAKRGGTGGYQ
mmetsp:Transcript_41439/g.102241  ORF Transcript_41439/g.102241 Transcript_41439/m.102241 type:complete len:131 (+) Transcript_41439:689-1081(+)